MEELKVTPGEWWLSGNEIISGFHTKIAKIHPTNMNDMKEHKRNGKLLVNSKKMFTTIKTLLQLAKAQGAGDDWIEIIETQKLINEILEK